MVLLSILMQETTVFLSPRHTVEEGEDRERERERETISDREHEKEREWQIEH